MTARAPTEANPQQVVAWPGWVWWRDRHGIPHARRGALEVSAPSTRFTGLLEEIRRAEGARVRDEIAELEHLFPGSGWVFGSIWRSAASGPDHRNLTARRGTVFLTAADVPSLAALVRHEEDAGL